MRRVTGFLAAASLSLVLGACADGTGPLPTGDNLGSAPAGGANAAQPIQQMPIASATAATPTVLRFATWAPKLETYDTTYLVTQGKAAADTLYFKKGPLGGRMPYMVITVPKDAQWVDANGKPVSKGTVVKLTVHADSQLVQLDFGPHGSTFSKNPATVSISWFFTDLMGMSASNLVLWYQPNASTAWSALTTKVDLQFYWLTSTLDHFSNYAVAYRK